MSDDEYYANSNYDEYDDQTWDDAGDDIAGDLAEHAVHSPVYQYEPGYELLQGFSDWEYYSDDYYDDDPVLIGTAAQDGGLPTSSERVSRQPGDIIKPGKKRKLDEMQDIPADRKTLDQCIKGTVWAEKKSVTLPFYQEGDIGKVALLEEWRNVFKETKQGGKSRSTSRKRRLQREDPWANMSLQDMGLATAPRRSTSGAADVEGGIRADEDEELDLSQVLEEAVDDEWAEVYDDEGNDILADTEEGYKPRKRQRTNDFMQPPPTKRPALSKHHLGAEPSPDSVPHNSNGLQRRRQSGDKENHPEDADGLTHRLIVSAPVDLVRVKKRAASPSDDEKKVKSTISSRAKRVASSKLSTKKDAALEEVPPIPSRRVTRSRKKG